MALADTAELAVRLTLDDRMSSGIGKVQGKLSGLGRAASAAGHVIGTGLAVGATAGIAVLGAALKSGIEALKADQVQAAQTAAVIKSTGGAAGVTAQQVADLAEKLSMLNGVQDDVIQNTENLLLTFTNIGSKIFPDVTQAVLDMSAALNQDTKSSAIQLGKALQDPVKGVTALRRVGVMLSDQQQKAIQTVFTLTKAEQKQYLAIQKTSAAKAEAYKAGVFASRQDQAQAIILKEVQREFAGVAQAQADADPSKRLQIGIEKFQKALAKGLLPVIEKIQVRLTDFLSNPATLATVQKLGDSLAGLLTDQNLNTVADVLSTAASAVSTAIGAFNQLPPEIKALAIGAFAINKVTGGAVGGIAGAFGKILGAGLQKIFAANVTVIGTNVIGGGGAGVGDLAGKALPAAAGAGGVGAGTIALAAGSIVALGTAVEAAFLYGLPSLMNTITGNKTGKELDTGRQLGLTDTASRTMASLGLGNLMAQRTPKPDPMVEQHLRAIEKNTAPEQTAAAFRADERATGAKLDAINARLAQVRNRFSEFSGALGRVQRKAQTENSQFVGKQMAAALKEAQSSDPLARKQDVLASLQRSLIAHGDRWGAAQVARLSAIEAKKTSLVANFSANVSVVSSVSIRDMRQAAKISSRTTRGTIAQAQ